MWEENEHLLVYNPLKKIKAKRIIGFENAENIQTIKNHPWY